MKAMWMCMCMVNKMCRSMVSFSAGSPLKADMCR